MDNSDLGGNRGSFTERREVFGTPESFEKAFETDKRDNKETKRSLGETAGVMQEIFGEQGETEAQKDQVNKPEFDIPETPGMMPVPEIKPLANDGTTEGKRGRAVVSLGGERVDAESLELLNREVEKLSDKPYELDNLKNEALSDSLRNSFGRMIGNDDIGEIQAEAKRMEGAK